MSSRLLVIDSNALFNACYFAMQRNKLTAPNWFPTFAIYWFLNAINSAVLKVNPTYVLFTFDTKTSKNKNKSIYPQYKEGRTKKEPDFFVQMEELKRLIPNLWFTIYESSFFEADDVIATVVTKHKNDFDEIYIHTNDSDLFQLINEKTYIIRKDKVYDELLFQLEFENDKFTPSHYVHYKSLVGDGSDNIEGINKVWPKTAMKILQEVNFDLNELMKHPKVEPHKEIIERNLKLIWLEKEIEDIDIQKYMGAYDQKFVIDWINTFNMKSLYGMKISWLTTID